MSHGLEYTVFKSDKGWIGLMASAKGLLSITLPQSSFQEAKQRLGSRVNKARSCPHPFADLIERLKIYFTGGKVGFPDELDLSGATSFQQETWKATRLIPYGETKSYLWLAKQIGKPKAARAVGQALGRNPLPIVVPCHRVIASHGSLCGFSGGLQMKNYLLRLEASNI